MSLEELLYFSGSVLGPALVAQHLQRTLSRIPDLQGAAHDVPRRRSVDELLGLVFDEPDEERIGP